MTTRAWSRALANCMSSLAAGLHAHCVRHQSLTDEQGAEGSQFWCYRSWQQQFVGKPCPIFTFNILQTWRLVCMSVWSTASRCLYREACGRHMTTIAPPQQRAGSSGARAQL